MAFTFSPTFEFLIQTGTYAHQGEYDANSNPNTTNINGNIQIKFYPIWYKQITVEWSVPTDWGNCLFNVYFCPVEEGPFIKINPPPIIGTYLRDTTTQEYSKFSRGFYIVEAILVDQGGVSIKSPTSSWDTYQRHWVTLRSLEIQRREYILLSKFVGIKTYLFRRKHYGKRCPECWHVPTEKSIKDNCTTCFGTTFEGGYFVPATTFIQYDATPNSNMKVYFGKFEPNQIKCWTIAFPEVRVDDIIIRVGDWNIYRVDAVANTELQGNTVRQIMQITQLAKADIENQLLTKIVDFPGDYL